MNSATPDPPGDRQFDDGDVYRLLPPEPKSTTAEASVTSPEESAVPPERERPKKRKRRKPATAESPAGTEEPPPKADAADAPLPEWKPDTGWKEPSLASALWYPLSAGGWKLILLYSLLLWAATILPLVGAVIGFVVMVFHAVLLLETANYTLEGIPSSPQFPDWLSWDTISAGLMGLVIFVIAGVPLLIGVAIAVRLGGFPPALQMGLIAVALFYLPMAFLALAEQQSEQALNPLLVVRGIKTLSVEYVLLCGVATLVFLIPQYALLAFGPPLAWQLLAFSIGWVYVSVALLRAVALVARKRKLTFDDLDAEK